MLLHFGASTVNLPGYKPRVYSLQKFPLIISCGCSQNAEVPAKLISNEIESEPFVTGHFGGGITDLDAA
jgi:hypothetical protein